MTDRSPEDPVRDHAPMVPAGERQRPARQHDRRPPGVWLALSHQLARIVEPSLPLDDVCARVTEAMVAALGFQTVAFYEMDGHVLRPVPRRYRSRSISSVELTRSATGFAEGGSLACPPGAEPSLAALACAVGLERFLWHRVAATGVVPLLLVAGYDREHGGGVGEWDEEDVANFVNAVQYLSLLLGTHARARELERKCRELRVANAELEHRVQRRTAELDDARQVVRVKEDRMRHDVEQARVFQQKFLGEPPQSRRLDLCTVYRPLERVGCDVFDVRARGSGGIRVFVADAAGHGVQAALRTILIKTEYDRLKPRWQSPHGLLQQLNRRLVSLSPAADLISAACCVDIDPLPDGTARVTYANGGSVPLLLWRGSVASEVYREGPFLGFGDPTWPEPLVFDMTDGDMLLVASDGLGEQRDVGGRCFEDVLKTVPRDVGGSASDFVQSLLARLDEFRAAEPLSDDLTVVAVRLR